MVSYEPANPVRLGLDPDKHQGNVAMLPLCLMQISFLILAPDGVVNQLHAMTVSYTLGRNSSY